MGQFDCDSKCQFEQLLRGHQQPNQDGTAFVGSNLHGIIEKCVGWKFYIMSHESVEDRIHNSQSNDSSSVHDCRCQSQEQGKISFRVVLTWFLIMQSRFEVDDSSDEVQNASEPFISSPLPDEKPFLHGSPVVRTLTTLFSSSGRDQSASLHLYPICYER